MVLFELPNSLTISTPIGKSALLRWYTSPLYYVRYVPVERRDRRANGLAILLDIRGTFASHDAL